MVRQLQCGDLYDGGHLERAFTTSLPEAIIEERNRSL